MPDDTKPKQRRGFACMTPEKRREIASKGGKAIPPEKRSFFKNPELARAAGQKGGSNVAPANRTFSKDTELARKAGVKGGAASHRPSKKIEEPTP